MISLVATLGVALITAAVKCLSEETFGKAALAGLDTVFGGVLGNVCHEGYNRLQQHFDSATTHQQNADVERCSRDAVLTALIAFSEAAKPYVSSNGLTQRQQQDSIRFLEEAQRHFRRQLGQLGKLPDIAEVLRNNLLTNQDEITLSLAKGQDEWVDEMKNGLNEYALNEFTYKSGHVLYDQLSVWLSQGLPDRCHWFIFYVHAFHANLKKDEPAYCKNARRILSQQQTADILLLTKRNLLRLERLLPLSEEVKGLLLSANEKLDFIKEDTSAIRDDTKIILKKLSKINLQQDRSKYLNIFPHYDLTNLVGRESQLKFIKAHYVKHKLLLIRGIGGIGKSTLARAYISFTSDNYDHIAYVKVIGGIAESMLSQLGTSENIRLGVDSADKLEMRFAELLEVLRHKPNFLIVLDNVDDAEDLSKRKQDLESLHAFVLVTGRVTVSSFANQHGILELDALTAEEAMKLFEIHYKIPINKSESLLVEDILEKAFFHPKLIEIIAKAARVNFSLSLGRVAEIVGRNEYDDDELNFDIEVDDKTRKISLVLLDLYDTNNLSEEQKQMLRYFAIIYPANISIKDLAGLLRIESVAARQYFINLMERLTYLGWVDEQNNRSYSMHGLMQWVIIKRLLPNAYNCGDLIRAFNSGVKFEQDESPLLKQKYLQYTSNWIQIFKGSETEDLADAFGWIAGLHRALGEFDKAVSFALEAIAIREKEFSDNYEQLAASYNVIAVVLGDLTKHQEALNYQLKSLELKMAIFEPLDPRLALSYNNVGTAYRAVGDFLLALKFYKKSLGIRLVTSDRATVQLGLVFTNLASVYGSLNDHLRGLSFNRKALPIMEATLENHPDLAQFYSNFGENYGHLKNWQMALQYHQMAMDIREKILPESHPHVIESLENLRLTFFNLGDLHQSLIYGHQALGLLQQVRTPGDPRLADARRVVSLIEQAITV